MDHGLIRARRAAGETLQSIANDYGVSAVEIARRSWGGRTRSRPIADATRFVVEKIQIGKCSTDYHVNHISLARSAAVVPA